jgi:hypothetical protein
MNRINRHPAAQQLFHRRALAGFNRHAHGGMTLDLFPPVLPARPGVRNAEVFHHLALPVDDTNVVMILRPIEPGEVG